MIDYEDTPALVNERYNCLLPQINEELSSNSDRRMIMESAGDWQALQDEIQRRRVDSTLNARSRRYMSLFDFLPQTLIELVGHFEHALQPHIPKMDPLWGLWYVNLKLCYESPEKLKTTSGWIGRVRRVLELFNRSLDARADEEMDEARINLIEILEPLLFALANSIKYLRSARTEVINGLPKFETKIEAHLLAIEGTVKHLNEIRISTSVNRERMQETQS